MQNSMAKREGHLRTPWETVGLNCLGGSWQRRRRAWGSTKSKWVTGQARSSKDWRNTEPWKLEWEFTFQESRGSRLCASRKTGIAVDQVPIELPRTAEREGVDPTFDRPPLQHRLHGEPWICVFMSESKWVHTHFRRAALSMIEAGRETWDRVAVPFTVD